MKYELIKKITHEGNVFYYVDRDGLSIAGPEKFRDKDDLSADEQAKLWFNQIINNKPSREIISTHEA